MRCHNGHNKGDLGDFDPIITKSWRIMAASWYTCTIMNQNFLGIGPNLAISDRSWPLCRNRCMNACDISYPYRQIYWPYHWLKSCWNFYFRILPTLDLGRHRKFEWLFVVWGHWTVTVGPKYVIFYIFIVKKLASFLTQEIPKMFTSCGCDSFPITMTS